MGFPKSQLYIISVLRHGFFCGVYFSAQYNEILHCHFALYLFAQNSLPAAVRRNFRPPRHFLPPLLAKEGTSQHLYLNKGEIQRVSEKQKMHYLYLNFI